MANYNDYQLDEMENAAVNKSRNLKRAGIAGAAVLGVGGTAVYGANKIDELTSEESNDLTGEDLLEGAEAGVEGLEEAAPEAATTGTTETVHVYHHVETEEPQNTPEIDVDVEESAILYDEDGYLMATYDAGEIDGRDFVVIDSDLNGKGDILAYDANNNGRFEDHEITRIDNETYDMGQGKEVNIYAMDENGNMVKVNTNGPVFEPRHDDLADIHNDFEDEKTGDLYEDDLAENNRDYVNDEADQYSAGYERSEGDLYAEVDDKYNDTIEGGDSNYDASGAQDDYAYEEPQDYGYTDPAADDMAFGSDSFDDPNAYDA